MVFVHPPLPRSRASFAFSLKGPAGELPRWRLATKDSKWRGGEWGLSDSRGEPIPLPAYPLNGALWRTSLAGGVLGELESTEVPAFRIYLPYRASMGKEYMWPLLYQKPPNPIALYQTHPVVGRIYPGQKEGWLEYGGACLALTADKVRDGLWLSGVGEKGVKDMRVVVEFPHEQWKGPLSPYWREYIGEPPNCMPYYVGGGVFKAARLKAWLKAALHVLGEVMWPSWGLEMEGFEYADEAVWVGVKGMVGHPAIYHSVMEVMRKVVRHAQILPACPRMLYSGGPTLIKERYIFGYEYILCKYLLKPHEEGVLGAMGFEEGLERDGWKLGGVRQQKYGFMYNPNEEPRLNAEVWYRHSSGWVDTTVGALMKHKGCRVW